jgi:hypothetical protein
MSKSLESKYKKNDCETFQMVPSKLVLSYKGLLKVFGSGENWKTNITLPQKNRIAVQCAAQILWNLKGQEISTIEKMIDRLQKKDDPIFALLELNRFAQKKTIRDWISPIFPISERWRKMKADHPQRALQFKELRPIPDIHAKDEIYMGKLLFATFCVARILKLQDWDESQITDSKVLNCLWAPVSQLIRKKYLKDWVSEAYLGNGRIFDL